MTNPFKVGDKVKCISPVAGRLEAGGEYVVAATQSKFIRIKDVTDQWWYANRFELVSTAKTDQELADEWRRLYDEEFKILKMRDEIEDKLSDRGYKRECQDWDGQGGGTYKFVKSVLI